MIPGAVGDALGAALPPDGAAVVVDGGGALELLYVVVPGALAFGAPLRSLLLAQPMEMTARVVRTIKDEVLRIGLSPTDKGFLRAAMSILLSEEFYYQLSGEHDHRFSGNMFPAVTTRVARFAPADENEEVSHAPRFAPIK
ncbi:MAG: hypothetical protein H0U54_03590 [Acidobacteria bacterium]|nr:hypothetical protein [Acidobacteriota bacterium]